MSLMWVTESLMKAYMVPENLHHGIFHYTQTKIHVFFLNKVYIVRFWTILDFLEERMASTCPPKTTLVEVSKGKGFI